MAESIPIDERCQFDVSFSELYFTSEADDLKTTKQQIKELYRIRIKDNLRLAKKCEEDVDEFTDDILENGLEIYPNACEDKEEVDYTKKANAAGREFHNDIPDRHFLHLNIPSGRDSFQDQEIRDFVFDSFIKKHPGVDKANLKAVTTRKTAYSCTEMEELVENFMKSQDARCAEATIIFNAHGVDEGLIFKNETTAYGTDTLSTKVKEIVSKYRVNPTPRSVRLIYTQCRGYKTFEKRDMEDGPVNVKVLTDEDHKNTKVKVGIKSQGAVDDVVSAFMVELNKFAEKEPVRPAVVANKDDTKDQPPSTEFEALKLQED